MSNPLNVGTTTEGGAERIQISVGEGLFAPRILLDADTARWLAGRLTTMADMIAPPAKKPRGSR